MTDDTMSRIALAAERGRQPGGREEARRALTELWHETGDGEALHRCTIAHFLADVQDDPAAELAWDERALAASEAITRAEETGSGWRVAALLPSLCASLADDHRRLGDPVRAREYLAQAEAAAPALGDDDYGLLVKGIITEIGEALDAGSEEPLAAD